uniref:Homeobox domain-containing protein n=1 Tax=Rhizophora mucronata TaxID=61149 RepID=A0A2P2LQ09_RHIMU
MMRLAKEEPSCMAEQIIDFASSVKELHGLSSQELNKLLRDSENFTIQFHSETRLTIKIDVEKLVGCLPLHLIAMLISSGRDESRLRYLLCGLRLLHSFFDLAPRHTKLEQILLDDVKVPEQLLDLVFLVLIILSGYRQDDNNSSSVSLLHSALLACSLHLLTGCLSSHWQDLVPVLLAHPKVDVFMDVAFGAVNVAIRFLQIKLLTHNLDYTNPGPTPEQLIIYLCQQCEASIQFLQSLCQQKFFRERLLRNKELCRKGGVLFLAQGILKLKISPILVLQSTIVAAVSRLKAKILSILLHLCEAESISYLDEVASSPRSLDLAKSVALEVLELLKAAVRKDLKHISACSEKNFPMGLLRLNAMRLADAFSDDSNFRLYITTCFTKVLTAIFLLPHGDFVSIWCSSELPPREEDATLEYDTFAAAGWVLDTFLSSNAPNTTNLGITLIPSNMPQPTYAHHRTSLFVKVIANLHCFVPNICEEQERNLFLRKFIECMRTDPSKSLPGFSFPFGAQKAITVSKNLGSLLSHAESLIPNFLSDEDVQLLRVFFRQLQSQINPADFEENQSQILDNKFEGSISLDRFSKLIIGEHHQEAQSTGRCSSAILRTVPPDVNDQNGEHKEEMSESSAVQEEQLNFRGKHLNQADDVVKEERDKSGGSASGVLRDIDRDAQNVDTSGSDASSTREKNVVGLTVNGDPKLSEGVKEIGPQGVQGDEKVEIVHPEEKQPRKRKRTIMNDYQMNLMEKALLDEPDMQRNAASLQSWADKLSVHGSEVTPSQLKNWLNNRKARLARAGKDLRAPMEVDTVVPEKQGGPGRRHLRDSPISPVEDSVLLGTRGLQNMPRTGAVENAGAALEEFVATTENAKCKAGQNVVLMNGKGDKIGRGKIHQTQGSWYGKSLEELGTCVVDVSELMAERWTRLPYPSEATGTSFGEAETKIGIMRVLWDSNSIHILRDK